jgi:hypothetical protein
MSRFIKVRVVKQQGFIKPDDRVRATLNYNQLRIVHAMSKSHSFVGNAIEHLAGSLLGGGIMIYREDEKDEKMGLEPAVERIIQTEWAAFCCDLLRDLMIYGFAIVVLDMQRKCPLTLDPATSVSEISISHDRFGRDRTYEITLDTNGLTSSLRGTNPDAGEVPPMFIVEEKAPTPEGDLRSRARKLIAEDAFQNTMRLCAVAAAQRNSRPAFITKTDQQTPESKAIGRSTVEIGDSTLGSAEALAFQHRQHAEASLQDVEAMRRSNVILEDNAIQQMQATIQHTNAGEGWQQLMHVKRTYDVGASGNSQVVVDNATGAVTYPEVVGAKQYMSAYIALPPHQSLETPPTAQAPAQIAELTELYRDVVAGVMGVPSVLWGSTRSSVAANQTVLNTFMDTKQRYRTILQIVIQRMFTAIFRDRIDKQNLAELRQVIAALTLDDTEKAKKKFKDKIDSDRNIAVALPGMLDLDVIERLQAQGLLTWEATVDASALYLGLPKRMFAEEKMDPMSGRPQSEVQEEAEQREEHLMEKQAKLKAAEGATGSLKVPSSKKPVGNQPPKKKPRT